MKRMSLTITLIAASFLLGFAFKTIISNKKNTTNEKSNRNRRHFLQM